MKKNTASTVPLSDRRVIIPKFIVASAVVSPLIAGLSLISVSAGVHAGCVVAPGAQIVGSTLSCDVQSEFDIIVEENVRVVNSTVEEDTRIGPRTQVLKSQIASAIIGPDSHLHQARVGSQGFPVQLGEGAVVDREASLSSATIGANANIGAAARVNGGRGLDTITVGDNFVLGRRAEFQMRQLGSNANIGADTYIGEGTRAGENFTFGDRSQWDVSGEVGDNVTIGRKVTIAGGVNIGSGTSIGAFSSISFVVRIGSNTNLSSGTTVENSSTIGSNVLMDRGVLIGTGATVGDRVLLGRSVQVGENVTIGADSIVSSGVTLAMDTQIPPNSFVERSGVVTSIVP
ncbi:MAG: DapH/DapD/GlmU-related protein [Granulosicoccus sp.]